MGNRIGSVVEFQTESRIATLTRPSNTTPYDVGDCISAVTTNAYLTFDDVANKGPSRLTGVISSATIWSNANVASKPEIEAWIFHTPIASVADNSAFAPSDAEMLTLVGVIQFPAADFFIGKADAGITGNCVCQVPSIGLPYQVNALGATPTVAFYCQLVARSAYIPVSGEIFTMRLMLTLD